MPFKSICAAIVAAIIFPVLGILAFVALVATHQQEPHELSNIHSVKAIALKPAPLSETARSTRQGQAAKQGLR